MIPTGGETVSSSRASPKRHHPSNDGIFQFTKNHPAIGYPHEFMETPNWKTYPHSIWTMACSFFRLVAGATSTMFRHIYTFIWEMSEHGVIIPFSTAFFYGRWRKNYGKICDHQIWCTRFSDLNPLPTGSHENLPPGYARGERSSRWHRGQLHGSRGWCANGERYGWIPQELVGLFHGDPPLVDGL